MSGSTFVWELHNITGSGLVVRSRWWAPGMDSMADLQNEMPLKELRQRYQDYIEKHGGPWNKLCDFKHFNPVHKHHERDGFINPETVSRKHTVSAAEVSNLSHTPSVSSDNDNTSNGTVAVAAGVLALSASSQPVGGSPAMPSSIVSIPAAIALGLSVLLTAKCCCCGTSAGAYHRI